MTADPDLIVQYEREAAKLKKINAVLMSRVERSIDQQFNAFSLFETAIALDHQVRSRTRQLQDALRSLERSNESLYRAKLQAEEASSLKSSVLISVTHDLLQPLNAARLTLSSLAEITGANNGGMLIEQVDRSLATLEELLRTLLDISKLDAGALKPDVRPIAVASLFEPLLDEFAPVAAKRGLSLRIVPTSLVVVSDYLMLRRVLQNLLANALQYTRNGTVLMGCRANGDQVSIEVHDTGPGIPKAQQDAIFAEFQRGDAGFGDQAGFGLGLSIVRRFATVLGHSVRVVSRVGHGSAFLVAMPRAAAASVAVDRREAKSVDFFHYSGLEGNKILVIENDPASAEAMASLLEKWGCDVATTVSTADAIERVGALGRVPDAIIADLHLDNDESGIDAVDELRQRFRSDVPALIVTADYSDNAAKEAAVYGLEILKKPVKPAEMRALLSFLLPR
ncbi:MAG: ATP-binding protein [Xanthobacteraceae bacterium]